MFLQGLWFELNKATSSIPFLHNSNSEEQVFFVSVGKAETTTSSLPICQFTLLMVCNYQSFKQVKGEINS
jgi:hypothetical protein